MSLALVEVSSLPAVAAVSPGRALPEGPGWFGSTWELPQGLEVKEGWPGDTVLHGWIETWISVAAAAECR
jgi:hypothetical protein